MPIIFDDKNKVEMIISNDTLDIYISGIIQDSDGQMIANQIKNVNDGISNLTFHINSYGGSVIAAYDIISAFKNTKLNVTSINEGFAVSAASIILAASKTAKAYDYSTALIHNPLMGNKSLEETEGSTKNFLTKIKDGIMAIYLNRMNIDSSKLSNMLNQETSLNAEEQKQFGLVDEVIITNNKPIYSNSMSMIEIYNVIDVHNKKEKVNMSKEETKKDAFEKGGKLTCSDCGAKMTIKNAGKIEETPKCCGKPMNYTSPIVKNEDDSDITMKEENTDAAGVPKSNSVNKKDKKVKNQLLKKEVKVLKLENFILKNNLDSRKEEITNAVEKHGVKILDTIIDFITPVEKTGKKIEAKKEVKNEKNENKELKETLLKVVNEANDVINGVIDESGKVEDKLELAKSIFDLNGDSNKRIEIKNSNPELYNELVEIYSNSL